MSNRTILYFPGIHCRPNELALVFELLNSAGISATVLPLTYDIGSSFFTPSYHQWLESHPHLCQWWMGLSLGASVSWILASTIHKFYRPKRLTLLNPFSNRSQLALLKGFSIQKQWDLIPEQYDIPSELFAEIYISEHDEKIPLLCKVGLLSKFRSENIHFLNADHSLSQNEMQISFYNQLTSKACYFQN